MIADCEVIDFHGHIGRWDALDMADDPDRMLFAMDRAGIDCACLFNIFHPDGRRGHDLTAAFITRHPDRFIGFAYASPLWPYDPVPELERAIDELGFRAIKIYPPYTPYNVDNPIWDPIYRFADTRGLALISHTGSEATCPPRLFANVAARFPNARFIIGHSGNIEPHRSEAIAVARAHRNVYLETCSTFRAPGVVEKLVAGAGATRVLFGSDIPLMDPRPQLGKILTAEISHDDKRQILGDNARRLLHL